MRSKKRLDTVFLIFDTEDGILWSHGPKAAWISTGAAKNAWNLCSKSYYDDKGDRIKPKFDDQTRYVIVEIHENFVRNLVEEK